MAVANTSRANELFVAGGTATMSITPAGALRALIILYAAYTGSADPTGIGSVTVGGNAATKIVETIYSARGVTAAFYYLNPPKSALTVIANVGTSIQTGYNWRASVYALSGVNLSAPIGEYGVYTTSSPSYQFTNAQIGGMTFAVCRNTVNGDGTWAIGAHEIAYLQYSYTYHGYSNPLTVTNPLCSANSTGTERGYVAVAVNPGVASSFIPKYSIFFDKKLNWDWLKKGGLWVPNNNGLVTA